jgi:signal transduction histidine kinase
MSRPRGTRAVVAAWQTGEVSGKRSGARDAVVAMRHRVRLVDLVGAALVMAAAAAPLDAERRGTAPWALVLLMLVPALTVLVRRRYPIATLTVAVFVAGIEVTAGNHTPAVVLPVCIAVYTLAQTSSRTWLIGCVAVVGVMMAVLEAGATPWRIANVPRLLANGTLQPVVAVAFAAALGVAVQANRDALRQARDRAERAEQTRELEAQRRVADDRLAIARDLHDSIAHRMAVINMQSAVASRAVRRNPNSAAAALGIIGEASRSVITEIRDMLWVLRTPPTEAHSPAPLDERLDSLLSVYTRTGLQIRVTRRGILPSLPIPAQDAVYGVVQEALTNAYKHGDREHAEMLLEHSERGVRITVSNPVRAQPGAEHLLPTSGHGLQGMRERLDTVRGTLSVSMSADRYELTAAIPIGAP